MKVFIVMFGIILVMMGILTSMLTIGNLIPSNYTGKEIFTTEEEYQAFKLAIADKSVKIQDLDVLNSNTPIVVQFNVEAKTFDYGNSNKVESSVIGLVFLSIIGVVIIYLGINDILS